MKNRLLSSDDGNALLEGVAFLAVALGLVFALSIQVFEMERRQLALSGLARNSMRSYLVESRTDLEGTVLSIQAKTPLLSQDQLSIDVTCRSKLCDDPGELIWLRLRTENLTALAYGIYVD